MHSFSHIATKFLKEYKVLTRRLYSQDVSEQKFEELGLNSKRLPRLEANLYRLLIAITEKMSKDFKNVAANVRYSGGQQFLSHVKDVLSEYELSGKQVVHLKRAVSREVIKAVQLMSLPEQRLTGELFSALDEKAVLVAKHGEKAQQHYFKRSLQTNVDRHPEFFKPLIDNYRGYLKGTVELFQSNNTVMAESA